ncbi:hypothetical protein C8J56DRAFT_1051023 [Mycena floridula]|nr:hypothetical protein C8J56DRAFT_1051023 [Mycena floridula]
MAAHPGLNREWIARSRLNGSFHAGDARCLAPFTDPYPGPNLLHFDTIVITTPNAHFIPQPFLSTESVRPRADGFFGVCDPTLWPQLFDPALPHLTCIERAPKYGNPLLLELDTSTSRRPFVPPDFIPEVSCFTKVTGMLAEPLRKRFSQAASQARIKGEEFLKRDGKAGHDYFRLLVDKMVGSVVILNHGHFTLENLVLAYAVCQRQLLELDAYILYQCRLKTKSRSLLSHAMGAFTYSLKEAEELYALEIPVWLVRPSLRVPMDMVISTVKEAETPDLVVNDWPENPFKELMSAEAGGIQGHGSLNQAEYEREESQTAKKRPKMPYDRSRKPLKSQNVNECLDLEITGIHGTLMPTLILPWETALVKIQHDVWRHDDMSPRPDPYRFYWFPHPKLFLRDLSNQDHIFYAWIVTRSTWLAGIQAECDGFGPILMKMWREHFWRIQQSLAGKPSERPPQAPASRNQKKNIALHQRNANLERNLFGSAQMLPAMPTTIRWQGVTVHGNGSVFHPDIKRDILWEVEENAFRAELKMLDHDLLVADWASPAGAATRDAILRAVFYDRSLTVDGVPSRLLGLGAGNWKDRVTYVERFRLLMLTWPGSMELNDLTVTCADRREFERAEQVIVDFYCRTFFFRYGRGPVTPHDLPVRVI